MNSKSLLYVANWKMQLSYAKSIDFARNNKNSFLEFSKTNTIVLCPSFDALASITQLFKNTAIKIGAQNCAPYPLGPYTGEVAAESLHELGCTYCIVGHSERRTYFHETDSLIGQKTKLLLENNIMPIVCIGETKEQHEKKETHTVLRTQLEALSHVNKTDKKIIIAYEPIWAIGTGIAAHPSYIQEIFNWLTQECTRSLGADYQLLYGGSVNEANAKEIKNISGINGFLIGNASLDFQKFQNIVLS